MTESSLTKLAILRRQDVEARTGLSRSAIYAAIQAGTFPPQIRLGPQTVGWLESEVADWIVARIVASRAATVSL